MCRKCALVPQEMIPIGEFKCMLEEKFEEWGVLYEKGTDYAEVNAVCEIGLGVTNRCNLRCIYCNQSVLADKNPYFKVDFPKDEIASCLEGFIVRGGGKAFGNGGVRRSDNIPRMEQGIWGVPSETSRNRAYTGNEFV